MPAGAGALGAGDRTPEGASLGSRSRAAFFLLTAALARCCPERNPPRPQGAAFARFRYPGASSRPQSKRATRSFSARLPKESIDAREAPRRRAPATKKEILSQNAGDESSFRRDVSRARPVPSSLTDNLKKIAIEAFFREDRNDPRGWSHVVSGQSAGGPESLWRIAEWSTGDGANYRAIRSEGRSPLPRPSRGRVVRIPARLLLFPPHGGRRFASRVLRGVPRLRKGRVRALRALTAEGRARRSTRPSSCASRAGPRGRRQREGRGDRGAQRDSGRALHSRRLSRPGIPLDDLAPEFRPPDDPARIEAEKARLEAGSSSTTSARRTFPASRSCSTPGTAAATPGPSSPGTERGEARSMTSACWWRPCCGSTRGTRRFTVSGEGALPDEGRRRRSSTGATAQVQTHPPYPIEDTVAGVNLRWYSSPTPSSAARRAKGARRTARSSCRSMPTPSTLPCAWPHGLHPRREVPGRPFLPHGEIQLPEPARGEGGVPPVLLPEGAHQGGVACLSTWRRRSSPRSGPEPRGGDSAGWSREGGEVASSFLKCPLETVLSYWSEALGYTVILQSTARGMVTAWNSQPSLPPRRSRC